MSAEVHVSEFRGVGARTWFKGEAVDNGWEHRSWRVLLRFEGRRMQTSFRTGMAAEVPTAWDVIADLVADSWLADDPDMFAEVMGGDIYEPATERAYLQVERQNVRFMNLLGDRYEEFRQIKY